VAADVHLRLNGPVLDLDGTEAADFIEESFRKSEMRIARIEPWLRERVREF
jgi:prophage maintenance system killer protein